MVPLVKTVTFSPASGAGPGAGPEQAARARAAAQSGERRIRGTPELNRPDGAFLKALQTSGKAVAFAIEPHDPAVLDRTKGCASNKERLRLRVEFVEYRVALD